MKKEDLLKAVGGADDRFIAEAAPKKINFKNRAPRYPMRLMTAAASTRRILSTIRCHSSRLSEEMLLSGRIFASYRVSSA